MSELKPVNCGCGGEAVIYDVDMPNIDEYKICHGCYVICKNCGVRTGMYDFPSNAIEAWNKAMGCDKIDELIENLYREKLESREAIVNLVRRMLK